MPKLILASGSSYKRALMARLGLSFESIISEADETSLPGETPPVCAARLAVDKAKAVAAAHPDAWVIGCDQIIGGFDGRAFRDITGDRIDIEDQLAANGSPGQHHVDRLATGREGDLTEVFDG